MSTLQDPAILPADGVDPRNVTISGDVIDECYGPGSVTTTDRDDPAQAHPRIGRPGQYPYIRPSDA